MLRPVANRHRVTPFRELQVSPCALYARLAAVKLTRMQ